MVAAAVIGSAVVGAAGSAIAGSEAASATTAASNASIAEQNQALNQQATLSAPYRALGKGAIPQLQALLGIGGDSSSALKALQQTPGYQFSLDQGTRATKNAAASSGMLLSGNTLEGLDQFSQGLAQNTYQQSVGNLENVVGMGQAAAAGQAANIGNAAGNISNTLTNQGNTLAGIDANTIAGITKAAGGATDQYITLQTLNALNDPYSGFGSGANANGALAGAGFGGP